MPRYRFGDFVLSPRRRLLIRDGRELPLIPRYFDLLTFLIERRHEAVHRRDIFDRVWSDVIVSDSALSQAIRTIRRALADDSREPRFIRTVSRHGYRFVYADIVEEDDDAAWPAAHPAATITGGEMPVDAVEPLLARLTTVPSTSIEEEEQHEAAELIHGLGTSQALAHLGSRPGHVHARAVLRDARWDLPAADPVPVIGGPAPLAVARELIAIRLRRVARMIALRWAGASIGGGLAGFAAGALGGLILAAAPGSAAPIAVAPVLAVIGALCGGAGGAGVGAGMTFSPRKERDRGAARLSRWAERSAAGSSGPPFNGSGDGRSPPSSGWTSTSAAPSKASSLARRQAPATRSLRGRPEGWRRPPGSIAFMPPP